MHSCQQIHNIKVKMCDDIEQPATAGFQIMPNKCFHFYLTVPLKVEIIIRKSDLLE